MSKLTSVVLSHVADIDAVEGLTGGSPDSGRVDAFEKAFAQHVDGPFENPAVNARSAVQALSETAIVDNGKVQQVAPAGIERLDPVVTNATPLQGDMILQGLQMLRTEFDAQQARIHQAVGTGNLTNTEQLLSAQMEIANFGLLVELTSKLVGKSTQALDTLMKGQ